MSYQVVVADDHALFREGLKRVIEEHPEVEIVGEASDGRELLDLLSRLHPDLILLDISMPNLRGIEAISEIRRTHPDVKILILTMHREYVYETIAAGANGYFLKRDADADLFSAIQKVRRERFMSLLSFRIRQRSIGRRSAGIPEAPVDFTGKRDFEIDCRGKVEQGNRRPSFHQRFHVKRHRANIMEKLSLNKTADLVKYAIQKGYI